MVSRKYLNTNRIKDFSEYLDKEIQCRENNSFIKPPFGKESLEFTKGYVFGELKAYQKVLERWKKLREVSKEKVK